MQKKSVEFPKGVIVVQKKLKRFFEDMKTRKELLILLFDREYESLRM